MKKILTLTLALISVFILTACGGSPQKADSAAAKNEASAAAVKTAENDDTPKNILVAYFSCTGTTKSLAEQTAKVLHGDIYEIKPAAPYSTADLDYNDEMCRAKIEQDSPNLRPELAEAVPDLSKYDTIVIAYPIWYGQEPRVVDSFTEKADFANKTVVPICTSGGSDIGRSGEFLRQLASPKANWKEGRRFESIDEDVIEAFFYEIGLMK